MFRSESRALLTLPDYLLIQPISWVFVQICAMAILRTEGAITLWGTGISNKLRVSLEIELGVLYTLFGIPF